MIRCGNDQGIDIRAVEQRPKIDNKFRSFSGQRFNLFTHWLAPIFVDVTNGDNLTVTNLGEESGQGLAATAPQDGYPTFSLGDLEAFASDAVEATAATLPTNFRRSRFFITQTP